MFLNAVEFLKLEKVEYAGIKGKMLSSQTVAIFEEFNEMYKTFQEITYDPLDPQDTVRVDTSLALGLQLSCRLLLFYRYIVSVAVAVPLVSWGTTAATRVPRLRIGERPREWTRG